MHREYPINEIVNVSITESGINIKKRYSDETLCAYLLMKERDNAKDPAIKQKMREIISYLIEMGRNET